MKWCKFNSPNISVVIQSCVETWLNVAPCALILMLLLGPDNFGIWILFAFGLHQVEGER